MGSTNLENIVAVTGASGFVGSRLVAELVARGFFVRAITRRSPLSPCGVNSRHDTFCLGDIDSRTEWSTALAGVTTIIHCAAHVHLTRGADQDAIEYYREVNVRGTLKLSEEAAKAGVKRLVFLSSIGVNGSVTKHGERFTSTDTIAPKEAYAISKMEGERALWGVSKNAGLEVVIVRPPLIYGPNAKGNVARLYKFVRSGIPLPFGAIKNQRSMIGLDNLIDFLITCNTHPEAVGRTFLVSDGVDLSTPEFMRLVAGEMGKISRMYPVPLWLLRLIAHFMGRGGDLSRLSGSLQIDCNSSNRLLGWQPPFTVREGVRRMVLEWCD